MSNLTWSSEIIGYSPEQANTEALDFGSRIEALIAKALIRSTQECEEPALNTEQNAMGILTDLAGLFGGARNLLSVGRRISGVTESGGMQPTAEAYARFYLDPTNNPWQTYCAPFEVLEAHIYNLSTIVVLLRDHLEKAIVIEDLPDRESKKPDQELISSFLAFAKTVIRPKDIFTENESEARIKAAKQARQNQETAIRVKIDPLAARRIGEPASRTDVEVLLTELFDGPLGTESFRNLDAVMANVLASIKNENGDVDPQRIDDLVEAVRSGLITPKELEKLLDPDIYQDFYVIYLLMQDHLPGFEPTHAHRKAQFNEMFRDLKLPEMTEEYYLKAINSVLSEFPPEFKEIVDSAIRDGRIHLDGLTGYSIDGVMLPSHEGRHLIRVRDHKTIYTIISLAHELGHLLHYSIADKVLVGGFDRMPGDTAKEILAVFFEIRLLKKLLDNEESEQTKAYFNFWMLYRLMGNYARQCLQTRMIRRFYAEKIKGELTKDVCDRITIEETQLQLGPLFGDLSNSSAKGLWQEVINTFKDDPLASSYYAVATLFALALNQKFESLSINGRYNLVRELFKTTEFRNPMIDFLIKHLGTVGNPRKLNMEELIQSARVEIRRLGDDAKKYLQKHGIKKMI